MDLGYRVAQQELSLFYVENDPGETRDLAAKNPEIVDRLSALAQKIRSELGDTLQKTTGSEVRAVGFDP
ncbi:MAG: hypothetical protein EXS36_17815 [Pedosphaera sp.]|nr:hypothetical protein [Pedosphaera sp.]